MKPIPLRENIADLICRMISRKKMENESYTEYYYEKTELIQREDLKMRM